MGHRTLKRVPLDFNWPKGEVWKGYLNPYQFQTCKDCNGDGYNPETKKISDNFYDFARTGRILRLFRLAQNENKIGEHG